MTLPRTYSAENHSSDNGTRRTKGAIRIAAEDEARSAWLDAAIRTRAIELAREKGKQSAKGIATKPKRVRWECPNCGHRNSGVWCLECKMVRGT